MTLLNPKQEGIWSPTPFLCTCVNCKKKIRKFRDLIDTGPKPAYFLEQNNSGAFKYLRILFWIWAYPHKWTTPQTLVPYFWSSFRLSSTFSLQEIYSSLSVYLEEEEEKKEKKEKWRRKRGRKKEKAVLTCNTSTDLKLNDHLTPEAHRHKLQT